MQSLISAEISNVINMGSLAIGQLLESAQDKGISLELETSEIENQVWIFISFILNDPICDN